ncbi:MAG: hypothetical protein BGP06_16755 [Rhizobiales bacterium 65-9]|nr:MAG: hypothetical protein BGP06_16755 [Rhizobiales bacterium 65-9]
MQEAEAAGDARRGRADDASATCAAPGADPSGWSFAALTALPTAVCVVNRAGTVQFANQAALRLARRAPAIGRDSFTACWRLLTADGAPLAAHDQPAAIALQENRPTIETELIVERPGDHGVPALASATPLRDATGAATGAIVTLTDISQSKREQARLQHLARHDALTGALNRAQFLQALGRAHAATEGGARPFALLLVDLGGLRAINAGLGAHAGDVVLRETARRLREALGERDRFGRIDGDEFAIVRWLGDEPEREAALFAQRLLSQLGKPFDAAAIRASIGVAVMRNEEACDADMLTQRAELALDEARAGRCNSWRLFTPDMATEMEARRRIESDMRAALKDEAFALAFQPIADIVTRETVAAEALIRWRRKDGYLPPDAFIPIAEQTRLILPLGRWVLGAACAAAATWRSAAKVSVNISAVQLEHDDVPANVDQALRRSGLDPTRLELEITETALMRDTERAIAALATVRERGVSIVLDDFGSGYSSLSYLRMFPFDKIKIDRSFVINPNSGDDSIAIVAAVAGLGRALGVNTVAEGIETEEQLTLARAAGITQIQGYLIGRPAISGDQLTRRRTVRVPRANAG